MKIGFLSGYDKGKIEFAGKNGFGSIQLIVNPGGPLDPTTVGRDAILEAKEFIEGAGVEISALGAYRGNCLHGDSAERGAAIEFLKKTMDLCETLDVAVLGTVPGRDTEKSIDENIAGFKEVFTPLARMAEDAGLRIAFENCPRFHYFPFRGVNIAYCPRAWDMMFDAVPSEALGLEYDPSHPVSMFMDVIEPIHRYGERIYHVHAKDTEILKGNLSENGILQPGMFRYRLPGYGDVDWVRFVSALFEIGYSGNMDIEGCVDPMSLGSEEQGLLLAKKFLSQVLP
ncbi:MAG: sugar phosphate isomerase/epimerase [Spirochaetales bacterium]|nr:sugar phosphate isomerase/epimerase [Spirochaetales bacterium]